MQDVASQFSQVVQMWILTACLQIVATHFKFDDGRKGTI